MADGPGVVLPRNTKDEPNRPARRRLQNQASRAGLFEASGEGAAMRPHRTRLHILIADDDPAIPRLLHANLKSRGYAVSKAKSAYTALDLLNRDIPDLVVLDPYALGGLNVIRQIRDKDRTLPIIILSGCDKESSKVSAFDLGADD